MKNNQKNQEKNQDPIIDTQNSETGVIVAPETTTILISEKIGIVVDCDRLNVRTESSIDSTIAGIVKKSEEVTVYDDGLDELFYKVKTKSGIDGFCMKKYISVRP